MRYKAQALDSYQTLVGGFDVELTFDEEDDNIMHVELFEAGASIFSTDLDISVFTNPDGETYTEDLIEDAAAAAVDLFEASRGTLGQGAEVLREANMKKSACFESMYKEDWYMAFKGTPFQEQATTLLESYLNTFAPSDPSNDVSMQIATAQREHEELIYRMDMLYFEKMKADTGRKTVIVINAKTAFYTDELESWLNKFEGHKLEPQALALAKEYLDTEAKLQTLYEQRENPWDEREDLHFAMEELKLQLLQQNIEVNLPDEGPELAPKMMNDMFELAEGVSFDEPLEPMSDLPSSIYDQTLISPDPMFSLASRRRAQQAQATPEMWNEAFLLAYNEVSAELLGLTEKAILSNMGDEANEPSAKDVASEEADRVINSLVEKIASDSERWFVKESPDASRYLAHAEENEALLKEIIAKGIDDLCEAVRMDYGVSCSGKAWSLEKSALQTLFYYINHPLSSTTSKKRGQTDEVTENEPTEVIEKGELHGDLDLAEIPKSEQPYEVGESVTVSKAYELPLWGGGTQDISKGTKGVVDGLLDGNGDCVLVRLDMGDEERSKLVTIPVEHLGK